MQGIQHRSGARLWRRSEVQASDCLYYYDQTYNHGVVVESDPAIRGRTFHAAAAAYIAKLIRTQTVSDHDLAVEAFEEAVQAELTPGYLIPECEDLFTRWAERFELQLEHALLVEAQLVTERRGRAFRWQPDLVYARPDGIVIYDWKTHFVALTPEQARADFQSRFYLLMAADQWPHQPSYTFVFIYIRLGVQVTVTFTPADLEEIERQIEAAIAVVEEADRRQEYPARSGNHCQYCRLDCPINGTATRMPVRVDSVEDFAAIAGEYLALRQRLKTSGDALRTFVAGAGPTTVNGMTFGFWPVRTTTYPVSDVVEILESHGLDVPPLSVSKTALGALTNPRKYPVIAGDLDGVKTEDVSYEFEPRKAK